MPNVFAYLDYREFLTDCFKALKESGLGFTQESLAKAASLRSTYLTNVLKGRGNFNSDQIYAIANALKLNASESHYLFLLKEYDQCLAAGRKKLLKDEIEKLQQKMLKIENNISIKVRRDEHALIMKYYSDPMIMIVHSMLQISRFAENWPSLTTALTIQKSYLQKLIETLIELELIIVKETRATVLQKNFHLPKESPMLLPHQTLMRQKSSQRLQEVPIEKRFSFSALFTANEETRQQVHQKFLEFLRSIEPLIKEADAQNAYQLNCDLFPWND
jgi:uncharacterized protein (TIGR02147 family)